MIDFKFIQIFLRTRLKIDLFASRLNYQLKPFVSLWQDPEAVSVDSFTLDWGDMEFYAFPPLNMIPRVLNKIFTDKATGLLVVPDWPYSCWYPQFMRM